MHLSRSGCCTDLRHRIQGSCTKAAPGRFRGQACTIGFPVNEGIMAYEGYLLILFGGVIVVQQSVIYLMYVRIRQLLKEINSMDSKIKITDS